MDIKELMGTMLSGDALKGLSSLTGSSKKDVQGGDVLLGVRPEHIVLADKPGEHAIPVTLEVNEMMGSELHLHVYTEDGTRLIVRIPTIDLNDEQREGMVRGAKLYITFEGKVMHFFDPEKETNLIYG